MILSRQWTNTSSTYSDDYAKSHLAHSIADSTAPLTRTPSDAGYTSKADYTMPTTTNGGGKRRFGFSEIAQLFIRMKRHQKRSAARLSGDTSNAGEQASSSTRLEDDVDGPHRTISGESKATDLEDGTSSPQYPPRETPTPPAPGSPKRIQIRHFGTHSMFHGGKSKAHHLCSSSGEEPLSHPGLKESAVPGLEAIPVEYTDRFECEGGVNAVTLVRVTRNTLLETVEEFLGANALVDETWDCTVCGPKHGHTYKVEITYSGTAIRCSTPDPRRAVAVEKARGVPGLMTILKREDV